MGTNTLNNITEKEFRIEFGNRLQKILKTKGISQGELSERTGIGACMISNYINGKHTPSFYVIDCIVKALDISADDLRCV